MKLSELYDLLALTRALSQILRVIGATTSKGRFLRTDWEHLENVLTKLRKIVEEIEQQETDSSYIVVEKDLGWNDKEFRFDKVPNFFEEK